MPLTFNPHKFFFITVLFSSFLGYFFNSGIIAYGPLIVAGLLVVVFELILKNEHNKKDLLAMSLWIPYVIWAGIIYIRNPFEGRYLSTYLLSIVLLPVLVLTFSNLLKRQEIVANFQFVYKALLCFLVFQLFVCLGQISTYSFGVGLPVSELYAAQRMVTGTFTNSNDLAAIVLAIIFVVLGLEKRFFQDDKYCFWIVVTILLLITGSRSAIFLASLLFILNKATNPKKILIYGVISFIVFLVSIFFISNIETEIVARFSRRLASLVNVLQHGISADNSMTIRVSSYLHFLDKIPELGLGSGEINNYFKYSDGADFRDTDLLFQNPHSLIVELGYWLGLPGIILFLAPILFLLNYSDRKLSLLLVFFLVSMIPSSILGNLLFFFVLVLSFFDFRVTHKNNFYHLQ